MEQHLHLGSVFHFPRHAWRLISHLSPNLTNLTISTIKLDAAPSYKLSHWCHLDQDQILVVFKPLFLATYFLNFCLMPICQCYGLNVQNLLKSLMCR